MINFFNNFRNPYFWSILGQKNCFFQNYDPFTQKISYRFLTPFQKKKFFLIKKNNNLKKKKKIKLQNYAQTNGRMDGETFYRTLPGYHQGSNNLPWWLWKISSKTIIMELFSREVLAQRCSAKRFFEKFCTVNWKTTVWESF